MMGLMGFMIAGSLFLAMGILCSWAVSLGQIPSAVCYGLAGVFALYSLYNAILIIIHEEKDKALKGE